MNKKELGLIGNARAGAGALPQEERKPVAKENFEFSAAVAEMEQSATGKTVFHDLYGNQYTADELAMLAIGKKTPLRCYVGKEAGEWEREAEK